MRDFGSLKSVGKHDVEELYGSYYDSLDEVRLSDWPAHFAVECLYRVVSRENFERGLRLSTMVAESRGMLIDRVTGLTRTQVYAPRYYRRFAGPQRIGSVANGRLPVQHNLLMVQTLTDKQSEIVLSARCRDQLVVEEGQLLIKERIVVFDSEMIPNSLIYPA
jgi:3-phenylpropionate/cinnamic acid dioxygenase small subunit